eukprot:s4688_g1.t1
MAKIPQSNIAYNADQVDAEEGQVRLEEKNKKRVRYWWEEGYVPGNEKDSDDESSASASGGETKDSESCKPPETNTLPSLDPGEDSDYEAVVPGGGAKGGRFMRWGGLHGRLCLADGALAVEDGDAGELPSRAPPPLQDYLDELLMPAADAEDEEEAQAKEASRLALENAPSASAAETSAIVLYQTPAPKPWSFCTLTDHFSAAEVDQSEVRRMFAIEDSKHNHRLYTEEMQVLSQVAIGNYLLRQQQGMEVVQKAKEDEAIRKRRVTEGSKEQLPGTKQPLAVSQAWQDHLGKGKEAQDDPPKPRQRRTLLPGSLSGASSSSSSQQPAQKDGAKQGLPASGRPLLKEKLPGPRGASSKAMDPKYADAFDFEPTFRMPEMPLSRRAYRPSTFDQTGDADR